MKTEQLNMLDVNFYRAIMQSFVENPVMKAIIAALFSLFTVPLEFVIAIPIFWTIDFGAGVYASRKRKEKFTRDKLNSQFVKISIHMTFLVGCVILANLFSVEQFILFGFGYIIVNEFVFSTIPHLFGQKEGLKIIKHLKKTFLKAIGIDIVELDPKGKDDDQY